MSVAIDQHLEVGLELEKSFMTREGFGLSTSSALLKELLAFAEKKGEGVQDLLRQMTAMPWAVHYTPQLLKLTEERLGAQAQAGEAPNPIAAASNVHGPESFSPFPRGALVVVDLNRSSAFFHKVNDVQREALDTALQERFGTLMRETGATLVQKPAGDQYAFFLEYLDSEEDNTARLQDFMQRLETLDIPTGLSGRDYARIGLHPEDYPNDHFTKATGVHECDAGQLQAAVFLDSEESPHGFSAILGSGFAAGIMLQKTANPGETKYCDRSQSRMQTPVAQGYVPSPRPKEPFLFGADARHMESETLAIFKALHHRSSLEENPKQLGTTYIGLRVGDASTIATPQVYARVARIVFEVLTNPRFSGFSIPKQDFTMLHFEVDARHRHDQDLVLEFCNTLLLYFGLEGFSASAGVAHADAMLTTQYKGSLAQDRSSSAIVEAVRCAATAPVGRIACGRSALALWGARTEFGVKHLKEGPLFFALNDEGRSTELTSKALVGVTEPLDELRAFCSSTSPSESPVYALGPEEALQGKGAGVSALFRQIEREAPEGSPVHWIENHENGGWGYIRGILKVMGRYFKGEEEEIQEAFNRMLVEEDWSVPRTFILDVPHLSAEEAEAYSRLVAVWADTPTKLLCVQGPHVNMFKTIRPHFVKERTLAELTPRAACDLLMEARPDLKAEDYDSILAALTHERAKHPGLEFTPRQVLHVYAPALTRAGTIFEFDGGALQSVRAGDLGVALKEDGVSLLGRKIMGVLAHSKRSEWTPLVLHAFYLKHTGEELSFEDFEKEVQVLRGKYLNDSPFLLGLKPRYAISAHELYVPSSVAAFSEALLGEVCFPEDFSQNEEEAYSEWAHLSNTLPTPNPRLRALTQFLAESYLKRGLRTEARHFYADYFHKRLKPTEADLPLLREALWLFADGEDPVAWEHAKQLTDPLLDGEPLEVELSLESLWRLYRISVKAHANHDDRKILDAELSEIRTLRDRACEVNPSKDEEDALKSRVLRALGSSASFYDLKLNPIAGRAFEDQESLRDAFAHEYSVLLKEEDKEPGSLFELELRAAEWRILAGRVKLIYGENKPEPHEAAKLFFGKASTALSSLRGTEREDPRQERDCQVFSNEADMYLLYLQWSRVRQAEPPVKQATRSEMLEQLGSPEAGMFAEGFAVYEDCCLKGDVLNRRAAMNHLANLSLLEISARALDLQEGEWERILVLVAQVRKYLSNQTEAGVNAELKNHLGGLYARLAM